jgi:hypothetical protein
MSADNEEILVTIKYYGWLTNPQYLFCEKCFSSFDNQKKEMLRTNCGDFIPRKMRKLPIATYDFTEMNKCANCSEYLSEKIKDLIKSKIDKQMLRLNTHHIFGTWNRKSLNTNQSNICSICQDRFPNCLLIECGHFVCEDCIEVIVNISDYNAKKCPECRKPLGNYKNGYVKTYGLY